MTVTTPSAIPDQPVPCPRCDYDLRGQAAPRCPECGEAFESLEALAAASEAAQHVFRRVMRWRQRIAIGMLAAVGVSGVLTSVVGGWTALLGVLLLWVASGAAFVLLLQVTYWRFSRRISRERRRELNGSFPILIFESLPFLFLSLPLLGAALVMIL